MRGLFSKCKVVIREGTPVEREQVEVGDGEFTLPTASGRRRFRRCTDPVNACGDVNLDDVVDVADILYLVNYLYRNGPSPGNP